MLPEAPNVRTPGTIVESQRALPGYLGGFRALGDKVFQAAKIATAKSTARLYILTPSLSKT